MRLFLTLAVLMAAFLALASPPAATANPLAPAPRIVYGDSTLISGALVQTWAKVLPQDRVTEVGLTLPLAVVENPPTQPGSGPHGAFVLNFPQVVQRTTYFNHLQLGWNPEGHEPENIWTVPHFDFHFEGVSLQSIIDIGFGAPLGNGLFGDPVAPSPERLPAGYVYPSQLALVPFMGVHAFRPEDLVPSDQFTAVMLAGFYNNTMIFVEPMITQEFLRRRQNFSLNVPQPAVLGRSTLYPTRFRATYDKKADVYYFVFDKFQRMR